MKTKENFSIKNKRILALERKCKKQEYEPFKGIKGFTIDKESRAVFYENREKSREYALEIRKPDGFVPKTGIILTPYIEESVQGKEVLDLGTGETALLAIHAAVNGAKSVIGFDIDESAIEWALHNVELNKITNLKLKKSNLFSKLKNQKVDIIISNPPQMPMRERSVHNSGGRTGRVIIEEIIKEAPNYLRPHGQICMNCFDFLGIEESFGKAEPLEKVFKDAGFGIEILRTDERRIRRGGQIEKSISDILEEYPKYKFREDDKGFYYKVVVVKGVLKK